MIREEHQGSSKDYPPFKLLTKHHPDMPRTLAGLWPFPGEPVPVSIWTALKFCQEPGEGEKFYQCYTQYQSDTIFS